MHYVPNPQEEVHLTGTLKLLYSEQSYLHKQVKDLEEKYKEGMQNASEEGKQDDAVETISKINDMMFAGDYIFKRRFLERMGKQLDVPYFARIDFLPEGSKQIITVYIGKYAFLPRDFEYRISDWRSPIASVYYNYSTPTKSASYEFVTPVKARPWLTENRKITGELQLRRNIEISKGQIVGIYDNSLRIDLLTSELSRKSGGKLEDIVKTIQSEQDKIIRTEPDNVVVVQGTAGSGKTTVAIHRMSYLFYTYKDYLKEDNTLLISSSKVLINYVAQTLPELEIYSLERDTFEGYIIKVFSEYNYIIDKSKLADGYSEDSNYKNSVEFLSAMHSYIESKKTEILRFVKILAGNSVFQIEKYLARLQNYAPYELIEILINNYSEYLEDLVDEKKQGNITVEKKISDMEYVIKKLKEKLGSYDPIKEYNNFLVSQFILGKFPIVINDRFDLDDLSACYYLGHYLRGVKPKDKVFKHIVVDEAQEMGLLNLFAIKAMSTTNGFTIFGDLNQSTDGRGRITSWDDLEAIWNKDILRFFEIKVSYRTTKQIVELARKILEKFPEFKHLPEPFDRDGDIPQVKTFDNRVVLIKTVVSEIQRIRAEGDLRAIGIIEFDIEELLNTSKVLSEEGIQNKIIDRNFDEFDGGGVYVVSPELVKGLEFNTVFVIDPNEKLLPHSPQSAKILFVAVTRAINNLYVYSIKSVNKLLT